MNTKDVVYPYRKRIKRASRKLARRIKQYPIWADRNNFEPTSDRSTRFVGRALRDLRKPLRSNERFLRWLERKLERVNGNGK